MGAMTCHGVSSSLMERLQGKRHDFCRLSGSPQVRAVVHAWLLDGGAHLSTLSSHLLPLSQPPIRYTCPKMLPAPAKAIGEGRGANSDHFMLHPAHITQLGAELL
jgi:hypothetical protein